jgi:hypothetical protein
VARYEKSVVPIVAVALTLTLGAGAVFAEDYVSRRTLADHTFPTTNSFEDPFLSTNVNVAVGAGQAVDLQIPLLVSDGVPLYVVEGDIAFLVLQLAYQQRVASWISLGIEADVIARMGTTTASLVAEGGTAYYGPDFSAKLRILEKSRFALSGKLAASKRSLYDISPLAFAQDIINDGGIDTTTTLLSSSDGWRFEAGVSGVYVFSPRLGAKGFFSVQPGDRLREENIFDAPIATGVALSWDANPFHAPIGLVGTLLYKTSSDLSSDVADKVAGLGLGIYYKGRDELVLGIDLGWQRIEQKDVDTTISAATALLVLRYDF